MLASESASFRHRRSASAATQCGCRKQPSASACCLFHSYKLPFQLCSPVYQGSTPSRRPQHLERTCLRISILFAYHPRARLPLHNSMDRARLASKCGSSLLHIENGAFLGPSQSCRYIPTPALQLNAACALAHSRFLAHSQKIVPSGAPRPHFRRVM